MPLIGDMERFNIKPVQNDEYPLGIGKVIWWVFIFSWRPFGIALVVLSALTASVLVWSAQPFILHALMTVAYSLAIWFFLFVFGFVAGLGDCVALEIHKKLQAKFPMPPTFSKIVYFAISLLGFAVVAIFVSIGDSPLTRYMDG